MFYLRQNTNLFLTLHRDSEANLNVTTPTFNTLRFRTNNRFTRSKISMESNPVENYNRFIGPKVNVINRVDMNKIITPKTTISLDYLFFPEELTFWVGCTVRTVTLLQWFGLFIFIFSGLSFICNNQKKK